MCMELQAYMCMEWIQQSVIRTEMVFVHNKKLKPSYINLIVQNINSYEHKHQVELGSMINIKLVVYLLS